MRVIRGPPSRQGTSLGEAPAGLTRAGPHRRLWPMRMLLTAWLVTLTLLGGCAGAPSGPAPAIAAAPKLDAPWIPSAPAVISAMLAAANVGVGDTVYDL